MPPVLIPQPAIAPLVPPAHVVDLMTVDGSAAFGARWKVLEAKIVECPALTDSMPEFKTTYDIEPHAELSGFDDRDWPEVAPTDLGAKRGGGMVSFCWFRTTLTLPAHVAGFDTSGAKTVFTVNVDDYAEVWVNGVMPRAAGRPSPAMPARQATNSRSRCSPSTGRYRPRRQTSCGFARRRSSFIADQAGADQARGLTRRGG
jgi:hypothetical protein